MGDAGGDRLNDRGACWVEHTTKCRVAMHLLSRHIDPNAPDVRLRSFVFGKNTNGSVRDMEGGACNHETLIRRRAARSRRP